jgi:hypothetical protein
VLPRDFVIRRVQRRWQDVAEVGTPYKVRGTGYRTWPSRTVEDGAVRREGVARARVVAGTRYAMPRAHHPAVQTPLPFHFPTPPDR